MLLKILGCGTISNPGSANCSGYLIDGCVLIDCGPGIWKALGQNEIPVKNIKLILISHYHPDHIGDIPAVLLQKYLSDRQGELIIAGPYNIGSWHKKLIKAHGEWITEMPIRWLPLLKTDFYFDQYIIRAALTGHTPDSICLKITDEKNVSLFYSGDSDYNENLIGLAKECEAGIIEASNTEETKVNGHMTPLLATKLAKKAGIRKLILTHHYPEVNSVDYVKDLKRIFEGGIITARDNMELIF